MCKVSILVPIYNVEKYLPRCLESVVNQILQDIEIICINDGSTDGSADILQRFAASDARIKVIDKPNTGYGHSMNQGLRLSSGKYIGIVESDDYAAPEMMERLWSAAEAQDAEVVKSNYWLLSGEDNNEFYELLRGCRYGKVFPAISEPQLFRTDTVVWSSLYSREFLLRNDIWFNETPGAAYQDVAFTLKVLACAKRVYLLKDAFLHYRVDNMNASIQSKGKVYCDCDEFDELWRYLSEHPEAEQDAASLSAIAMHRIYQWNYGRIARKFRLEFLEREMQDFRLAEERGFLRQEHWPEAAWEHVQQMLKEPETCWFNTYREIQRAKMLEQSFLGSLRDAAGRIYLYGAGRVASSVLAYMRSKGIIPHGVMVTDEVPTGTELQGLTVSQYAPALLAREDLILVCVKDTDQYSILRQLRQDGMQNIMSVNSEVRACLEQ